MAGMDWRGTGSSSVEADAEEFSVMANLSVEGVMDFGVVEGYCWMG